MSPTLVSRNAEVIEQCASETRRSYTLGPAHTDWCDEDEAKAGFDNQVALAGGAAGGGWRG